jgi:hypothetical protein
LFVAYTGAALAGPAFSGASFSDSASVEPFVNPFRASSGTDVSSESSARS